MMEQLDDLGHPDLVKIIQERILSQGRITFAEFMEMALYTPDLGYYTSGEEKIGMEGDYYTSMDLHPLFGEMMGRQLAQIAEMSAWTENVPLSILEIGAGKGILCQNILNYIHRAHPQFYHRLTYWIIEKSPNMIQRQKERLLPYVQDGKVKWVDGLAHPVFLEGIVGFVLSNELLDSFPVHRLVKVTGALKEIYVTLKDGRFQEILDIPSRPDLSNYFEKLDVELEEGQQVEVNLKALDWIREVGRSLSQGMVITVDYGYPASELYSPARKRGTFLCYYKHRVSEDPYIRVGQQDMTAHVDFTSLALSGREVGLEVTGFTNQEYFLMGLGIAQEMEVRLQKHTDHQSREQELLAMKGLIAPDGLGRVFKVLIQHKRLKGLKLDGLTYRPFSPEVLFSL
ncbi:MAG: SAM-dependent methyltransferase [Nitrospira sp.]|nr:SAM-dependent methyltransferase [Nitrospira sp.]